MSFLSRGNPLWLPWAGTQACPYVDLLDSEFQRCIIVWASTGFRALKGGESHVARASSPWKHGQDGRATQFVVREF